MPPRRSGPARSTSASSTCPVRLTSAVRDLDLHFRQLHAKDHTPVETRRVCSEEDEEVAYEEIGTPTSYDGER